MTMSRTLTLRLSLVLASAVAFACAATGLAQDAPKPKDEALDSLLEKLDEAKSREKDAKADPAKAADEKAKADPKKAEAAKPSGDVETKDKALDSLLEKLGETKDMPSPDDRPRGPGGKPDDANQPPPDGANKPKPDDLKGDTKKLDEHLEELTGRRPKKKGGDDGEGSGPLSKVIKEMREVEQRLGKPDTGEETRRKQTEIVRNLEQLIDQLRQQQGQSQGKKQLRMTMQKGQKPGQDQGEQPGAMAQGVGPSKPTKPTTKRSLVGDKSEWGHLPAEVRQELENASSEEGLPSKEELIRKYFLSLTKKTVSREE
jgi:hypothetical protein